MSTTIIAVISIEFLLLGPGLLAWCIFELQDRMEWNEDRIAAQKDLLLAFSNDLSDLREKTQARLDQISIDISRIKQIQTNTQLVMTALEKIEERGYDRYATVAAAVEDIEKRLETIASEVRITNVVNHARP